MVQTATDLLEWSPHVYALASRGGWDREAQMIRRIYEVIAAGEVADL